MLEFKKEEKKVQIGIRLHESVWNKVKSLKPKYHVSYEAIVEAILIDYFKNND